METGPRRMMKAAMANAGEGGGEERLSRKAVTKDSQALVVQERQGL